MAIFALEVLRYRDQLQFAECLDHKAGPAHEEERQHRNNGCNERRESVDVTHLGEVKKGYDAAVSAEQRDGSEEETHVAPSHQKIGGANHGALRRNPQEEDAG
jgi:hypothetical protein